MAILQYYLARTLAISPTFHFRTLHSDRRRSSELGPAMCCGRQRPFSRDQFVDSPNENAVVVEDLRGRLADTEARLARARAREAELSRQLEAMRRFVSVMEILETYLKRRYIEQQDRLARLFSAG